MMTTVTVIKSNLTAEVLKSNLRGLAIRLGQTTNKNEIKEIHADMTYYSQILYNKVSFDEFMAFEMELDELR